MLSARDTEISKTAVLKQLMLVRETFKKTTTKKIQYKVNKCRGRGKFQKIGKSLGNKSQRGCGKANEGGSSVESKYSS